MMTFAHACRRGAQSATALAILYLGMMGCGLERSEPEAVATAASGGDLFQARPCRSDSYFAEVADNRGAPDWTNDFLSSGGNGGLIGEMTALANQQGLPWFCGAGQVT